MTYPVKCAAENEVLAQMFRSGMTLQEIGNVYGVTRERIRQRLNKIGVCRQEGGRALRTMALNVQRAAMSDLRCLKKYGCTVEHYKKILSGPKSGSGVRPTQAYVRQKTDARKRGIKWNLTLSEWWAIWQASGKWHLRGRGQGYAMCRVGDQGSYAIGNIYIGGKGDNNREYQAIRRGLKFIPHSELFIPA